MNYFLLLLIVQTIVPMQNKGSLDSSSLKAFQNESQVGCICMLCSLVKRMKFKINLVF